MIEEWYDNRVAAALDRVNPLDTRLPADWEDVIVRAGRTERPARRRRRLVVLAAAGGTLLALVPALAFTSVIPSVTDWLSSPPAAPSSLQSFADLDRQAPAGMAPDVIAAEARRLMTLRRSTGSDAHLVIAPTRSGGFCYEITAVPSVGCDAHREIAFGPGLAADNLSSGPAVIFGSVLMSEASNVRIRTGNGERRTVPLTRVSSPIDASFFLAELSMPTTFPISVDLLDGDGLTLVTKTIPAPPSP